MTPAYEVVGRIRPSHAELESHASRITWMEEACKIIEQDRHDCAVLLLDRVANLERERDAARKALVAVQECQYLGVVLLREALLLAKDRIHSDVCGGKQCCAECATITEALRVTEARARAKQEEVAALEAEQARLHRLFHDVSLCTNDPAIESLVREAIGEGYEP